MKCARDIMSTTLISVSQDTTIAEVCVIFFENGIDGVPVKANGDQLVGIVTEDDVVFASFQNNHKQPDRINVSQLFSSGFASFSGDLPEATPISEIMTRDVVTAGPQTSLKMLCQVMADNKIHRLPIVENGTILGMVTSGDILAAIAESDE